MNSKKTLLDWFKSNYFNLITALIIVVCVIGRITLYDDPRLSIATNDSSSYYSAANVPLFSWEAFTGRRLPSYPTFFKLFQPVDGYEAPTATSYPAARGVGTRHKALQPGFDNVVLAQAILSIFAWIIFVIVLAKRLSNKALRPIVAAVILFFAFSPPLAEWDSILMSESISFSFFTLLLALTIELLFRLISEKSKPGLVSKILIIFWMFLVPAWGFARDSNANTIIVMVVLFLVLLVIPKVGNRIPVYWVAGITLCLTGLLVLYSSGTFVANRWVFGWTDIWNDWISAYDVRIKFFTDHGMPSSWTEEWVKESGPRTYLLFLFNHPGFMVTEFFGRLSDAFSENLQPFYFTYPTMYRKLLLAVGDIFHPLSSAAFLLPVLNGLLILIVGIKNKIENNIPWLFFVIWIIAIIYALYLASFFADSAGLIRHNLGSVLYMRMMIWLLPIVLAEMVLNTRKV